MANAQTGVFGYDGTGTASTTTTALSQSATAISWVIFQNDPGSSSNIIVGVTPNPSLVIIPGQSITISTSNLTNIHFKTSSGTAIYNWSAFYV